jgi:alpha-mannosidase
MKPASWIGICVAIIWGSVGAAQVDAAETGTASNEPKRLWQIGDSDHSAAEFALGPGRWREFSTTFPSDPVFLVGKSDQKRDWPYAQPGPADAWAGSRQHTFTVFFGLKAAPAGACRLVVNLLDTHYQAPPKLQITVNAREFEHQTPVGGGSDDSLDGKSGAGRAHQFEIIIPADAVKAGNNVLTIKSLAGSWIVYDAIGFEAPEGAALTSVEPLSMITASNARPVLLRSEGGSPTQQIELSIQHIGEPADAEVSVNDAKGVPVKLMLGAHTVMVAVPAVEKATPAKVSLKIAGKEVAQQQIELKPVRKWTLYFLPHSHNDIGYTHVQTDVEKRQWGFLETVIEAARKSADNPPGSRFKWNVEVMWAVDGYLRQASPEKQKIFMDAVKAGWVELDALYGNQLTGLCRPEELMRLVESGVEISRRCGVPLESAMISDVPGYTWGIVPVLADAGVKYFSIGPNPGDRIGATLAAWGDKPFYWVSPSGDRKILCWVAGMGYGWFHGANLQKMGERPILDYVKHLDETGYPYDLVQVRYSTGGDNGPPDPTMSDFIKQWNAQYVSPRLAISTVSEMCRDFEKQYGDKIPTVSGDFTPYWEDGAASTARETAINRESAERLVQAEALFAMLRPDKYPVDEFYTAWRNVILYDEHTWGAYNSISEPDAQFVKDQWKIKQAFALDGDTQSRKLLIASVAWPDKADRATHVAVYNPTSWTRTGLVTLPEAGNSVVSVHGLDGAAVPHQDLASGECVFLAKDVPPFSARHYSLTRGHANTMSGPEEADTGVLRTTTLTVKCDPKTGAIVSLRAKGLEQDFVDPKAAVALNDYQYMLGSDAAGAKSNGPVKLTRKDAGPLVTSLLIESDAPGCKKLSREVRVFDGLDYVEIIDTVDKTAVRRKEGVHFGFAFNVPDGVMRMDTPWAVVRPESDQIAGACKNWFTVQRWVDVSNATYGVTWATLDAPLVEVGAMTADKIGSQTDVRAWLDHLKPSQTLYSWVMNNHWHTNYKADQDGPTVFRYYIQPHGAYDCAAAERFGIERSQPLIAVPVAAAASADQSEKPFLQIDTPSVLVSSLKPANGGKAILVRLFNASERPAKATLAWREPAPKTIYLSNLTEQKGKPVSGPIEMPAWGIVTLWCER